MVLCVKHSYLMHKLFVFGYVRRRGYGYGYCSLVVALISLNSYIATNRVFFIDFHAGATIPTSSFACRTGVLPA